MATESTQAELVAAAERLFATRGIDGPSLREITRAAQQRNTAALQYHFGDREALLAAVLHRHGAAVDLARHALLKPPPADLRGLAHALVMPWVAKLSDADRGVEFLQILGEVTARPQRFPDALAVALRSPSTDLWSHLVGPLIPAAALGRPLHRRFAAIRFTTGELATRARERSRRDHRLFASHLVDLVTALLGAPVSEETRRNIR